MTREIRCHLCGSGTMVEETRTNASGLRRRRRCMDPKCDGRLTTQEIVVRVSRCGAPKRYLDGEYVLVPRRKLEALEGAMRSMLECARRTEDERDGDGAALGETETGLPRPPEGKP